MDDRERMLAKFEEVYGLPGAQLSQDQWDCWLGIWATAWKYALESKPPETTGWTRIPGAAWFDLPNQSGPTPPGTRE